jgi:uncharacterized protein
MYNYDDDFINVTKKLSFTEREMMELYPLIEEILSHEKWQDMKRYKHHLETRAIHLLEVCCVAWRRAKKSKNADPKSTAIGAILHDFFLYDWQTEKADYKSLDIKLKVYSIRLHGFIHPFIAYHNANKYFPHLMNRKIKDIIIKHMWPLTVKPPRYNESWFVCLADKSCSLNVLKTPRELPRYLGIKMKNKNKLIN